MKSLSEFTFIKKINDKFSHTKSEVVLGIGDDCSVVNWDEQHYLITSTDMLIEGTHFLKEKIEPYDLGWKSLAVSYSDLAAMGGGEPLFIYLSFGLPDLGAERYINEFFSGMSDCMSDYGGSLIGGDTVRSEKITINVLMQGRIKKDRLKTRSKARPRDLICVSRELGDSEIGLFSVLNNFPVENKYIKAHHKPYPQLQHANWLSQFDGVRAMIDISDGLYSDLEHICEQSQVHAELNLELIPVNDESLKILNNKSFCEDYSILFTVDPEQFEIISKNFREKFNQNIIVIGKMGENDKADKITLQNSSSFQLVKGFNHFA